LKFEYSDLSANYPTHCMLTPTVPYAVKTSTTPCKCKVTIIQLAFFSVSVKDQA